MGEGITVGLDLAKNVFQAHGMDAAGQPAFRKTFHANFFAPSTTKRAGE